MQAPMRFAQRVCQKIGVPDAIPFELPVVAASRIARDYDVVHLHDLTTAMAPWTIRWLSARRPCFWTFHDCSPFTGGCFYPQDCDRFRERCGVRGGCPQLGKFPTNGKLDYTGLIQSMKKTLHKTGQVVALAPSEWMADIAFSSGKLLRRPLRVSNGVDVEVFRPAPNKILRKAELGVPVDRPIVLISAGDLRDPRKGFTHSIEALQAIGDLSPLALIVGKVDGTLTEAMRGVDFKAVGYLDSTAALSRWYSVADVFLFCSLADNQPLSILETMACGVPLVGFATGGIPEMVEAGRTGLVVPQHDVHALETALRATLKSAVTTAMSQAARRRAEQQYSSQKFLEKHLELYDRAIAGSDFRTLNESTDSRLDQSQQRLTKLM